MFWGCEVTQAKEYTLPTANAQEQLEEEAKMLHVSNVSLSSSDKKGASGTSIKVFCKVEDQKYVIANLQEGSVENYNLDLYFKQEEQVTFSLGGKGNASVHITGYWETAPDMMEDDYGMGPLEMDMDEEEDVELDPFTKQNLDKAKANAMKNALAEMEDDEDEESEDEVQPAAAVSNKTAKLAQVLNQLDDSEEESDDEAPLQAMGAPIAEDSDDVSEDDAPALVPTGGNNKPKQPQFEEDDSEEESDEFDVKAILANKKRKAQEHSNEGSNKMQKVDEGKERHIGKGDNKHDNKHNKGKPHHDKPHQGKPHHGKPHQGKPHQGKHDGGKPHQGRQSHGGDRSNGKHQNRGGSSSSFKDNSKKRHNKNNHKGKGKHERK